MKEKIEKQIQDAVNERQRLTNDIQELNTQIRVRQAEKIAINTFIDRLRELLREAD